MKRYIIAAVLLFTMLGTCWLVGCGADAVSSSPTNNTEIKVDLLFEHDGCKVYRFADYGYERYYAVCRDAQQVNVNGEHMEGKSSRPDEMVTVKKCE